MQDVLCLAQHAPAARLAQALKCCFRLTLLGQRALMENSSGERQTKQATVPRFAPSMVSSLEAAVVSQEQPLPGRHVRVRTMDRTEAIKRCGASE